MNYYIIETGSGGTAKNAAGKARVDINDIFRSLGMKKINLFYRQRDTVSQKIKGHFSAQRAWKNVFSQLQAGDCVFIQFPVKEHSVFLAECFREQRKKKVDIFLLIHDVRFLRYSKSREFSTSRKLLMRIEEKSAYKACSGIIAHNPHMAEKLQNLCHISAKKIVPLNIFDYLIPDDAQEQKVKSVVGKNMPVIIAGNLLPNKAHYLMALPDNCEFNLYGDGYEDTKCMNVHYIGAFLPDEIPFVLCGSFGLIWDGETSETCSGSYGEYLKMNNPHKTSLYLAAGIPVIVWSKAAMADFVLKNKCGITVDSLYDIKQKINAMTDEQYGLLRKSAQSVGKKLRSGFYTQQAVKNVIEQSNRGGYSLAGSGNTVCCYCRLEEREAA